MTTDSRFPMDADTFEAASAYLEERAVQALMDGVRRVGQVERLLTEGVEWGARGLCSDAQGREHQTVYVYASHRGEGRLRAHARADPRPIITHPDCDIEAYLQRKGIAYSVIGQFALCTEYRAIQRRYGDRRARRSGVFLMR